MSEIGSARAPAANEIREARRAAGLTEKALASQLGVSLWEIERLETGEVDPSPYAEALERHTGRPRSSFRTTASKGAPWRGRPRDQNGKPHLVSAAEVTGERLVLGSIAVLVLVRFFTEVVPLVPRAANFIDIPIVLALVVAALLRPPVRSTNDSLSRWLPTLGFGFLALSAVSAIVNPVPRRHRAGAGVRLWSPQPAARLRGGPAAVARGPGDSSVQVAGGAGNRAAPRCGRDRHSPLCRGQQPRRHRRNLRHQRVPARLLPAPRSSRSWRGSTRTSASAEWPDSRRF